MDQFEAFFRRADLDGDGRISGAEAVAFFQGTNLPKPVLAQIWTHADQSRTGYLGRQEFFNALKLVTVAQSKRDLTPDIVKAALYGPAAAKIPPPKINLAAIPGNQPSPVAAAGAPRPQMGAAATQGPGFRGPGVPNVNMNNQVNPMAAASTSRPQMGAATQGPGFRGPGVPGMNMNNQGIAAPRPQMGASTQGLAFRGAGVPAINMNNQVNPMAAAAAPRPQMVSATQGPGFWGPGVPSMNTNNQYYNPSQQSQMMRPAQPHSSIPHGSASHPHQGFGMIGQGQTMQQASTVSGPPQFTPGVGAAAAGGFGADWLGGRSGGTMVGPRGVTPSTSSTASLPQNQALASSQLQNLSLVPSQPHNQTSSQLAANDSKALVVSGSGSSNDSFFGDDVFSATPKTKQEQPPASSYSSTSGGQPPSKSNSLDSLLSAMNKPATSTTVPTSSGVQHVSQHVSKSNSLDSLQSAYAMQPLASQRERAQTLPSSGQQVSAPSSSSLPSSASLVGVGNNSDNSQILWQKMKPSDVQKYAKVFMEVDTDRDGKITGEEARNLFLSWRLPREILKQVWDLSDQDSDGMLSLREFCFSLYLMERYREGRPLPAALPSTVMYDETLLSMTGQPKGSLGNAAWGPSSGHGHHPGIGTRQMGPAAGLRPPVPVTASQHNAANAQNQQKSGAPALDDFFLNQGGGEQHSENSINQDGIGSDKKVEEAEKVILDSKEKIEYYRAKMQDLVLYKSRCDNRLNEITERAIADKCEAELLGKKYEEKYKQVAEVTSKLTIEEATLRDIHERKRELHQAIVNMEQGHSADGILQVRADRIQSDLDELLKALTERSKKHGLEIKSAAIIELPIGWQPGIQDTAVIWDEEWDKFEDEGFSNDLSLDMKNVSDSKSGTIQNERASADGSLTPDSLPNGDEKSRNFMSPTEDGHENESAYAHSEDGSARSPQDSPAGRAALESPSQAFSDVFAKGNGADTETHSFDESTWGAFDTNDDVDSVWGFNPSSNKGSESVKHGDFFGSDDFEVKPIRTGSTPTKSPFFEDSVAGSPVSRFGNSPRFSEAGDHFDNYSRFDSFSVNEGFSPREKLSRFDSINSTKDFGSHSRAFSSFDDTDPFGSTGPFKVSSEGQTSKKDSESWGNF